MRHIRRLPGSIFLVLLLLSAAVAMGCDRAAELIPGSATPTPTDLAGLPASSATPITVPGGGGSGGSVTGGETIDDRELAQSVVQVLAVDTSTGLERIVRYGSGVIVDADNRLIATAYPVVRSYTSSGSPAYSSIVIATGRDPQAEPQREFIAEVVRADADSGLALLKIVSQADGTEVGAFNLPAVALGEAPSSPTGFGLRLFGYPGVQPGIEPGPQAITLAQGTITGQRGNVEHTGRTWFKMDARLPFGAAGGAAFDRFGALVGIAAQEDYTPRGEVGQVRPISLLADMLADEQSGATFEGVAMYRTHTLPGSLGAPPSDGAYVSPASFAENAVETANGRDLFDYETRFATGLSALYYEYTIAGVPDGVTVEERWYLDGLIQDSLSSSFVWNQGGFGLVSDRITSPGAGIPSGRWRLDIYVGGVLHSTATAVVGVTLNTPNAAFVAMGSASAEDGTVAAQAYTGTPQLLAFFDLTGMEGARTFQWVVFQNNIPVYTSPTGVRWASGDSGRLWVGYEPDGALPPGTWDVELRADGTIIGSGSLALF